MSLTALKIKELQSLLLLSSALTMSGNSMAYPIQFLQIAGSSLTHSFGEGSANTWK
jgi:hypothetical protein